MKISTWVNLKITYMNLLLRKSRLLITAHSRIVDIRNDFVGPTYRIDYPSCVTSEKARNSNLSYSTVEQWELRCRVRVRWAEPHLTLSSNGVTLLPSPQLECSHWMINKSTNSDKNATYVRIFQFDNLRAKVFSQKSLRGWLHFRASAHSSRSVERLDKIIPDIYIHWIKGW